MTAQNPTPDDLRTIADNLWAEQHHSRAEVIYNAANRLELLEVGADKLTPAFAKQADELAALRVLVYDARVALKEVLQWIDTWEPEFTDDEEWADAEKNALETLAKLEGVK
jgi:hypothetical protein